MSLRLYVVFNPAVIDILKREPGKLAAQAGHAYLHAWWDAQDRFPALAQGYRNSAHAYKIALILPWDAEPAATFFNLLEAYREIAGVTKVVDAGFTIFDGPTLTCIGIGPIDLKDCGVDLKGLKLLKM